MTDSQPQADPTPAPVQDTTPQHNDDTKKGVSFDTKVLSSPKCILRVVVWVMALICFAAAADSPYYWYTSWLPGLIAFGVLLWLFSAFMIVVYFIAIPNIPQNALAPIRIVEMIVDGIFIVWAFINVIVGIAKCANEHKGYCNYWGQSIAALVFGAICGLLEVVSLLLSLFAFRVADKQTASTTPAQ